MIAMALALDPDGAHRRRADHRARRDRAGPDHGPARGAAARAQHGPDPDHPRPRRGRRRRGPDRGHVRRAGSSSSADVHDALRAARRTRTPRACSSRSRAWTRRARSWTPSRACRRTCCASRRAAPSTRAARYAPGHLPHRPSRRCARSAPGRGPAPATSPRRSSMAPWLSRSSRSATWSSTSRSPRASCFKKHDRRGQGRRRGQLRPAPGRDARHRRRVRLRQVHARPGC